VALFDNLFEILSGGGNLLGAGGGILAGEVYRRFRGAAKDAKEALKIAKDAKVLVENELAAGRTAAITAYNQGIADARAYVDEQLRKIARGSSVELQSEAERLTRLETRMSAVEDDLDARDNEERKWQGEIQRTLGRIEGQLLNR
jgi:hypothetical protein